MKREYGACGFAFDGLRTRAESKSPEDLEWLEEFFCPQFERTAASEARCSVRLTRSPRHFDGLLESMSGAPQRTIDAFALDQQVIRLPSWIGPGGSTCVYDAKFHVVYVLDAASNDVEIVISTMRRSPRVPAMRVLREYAMNRSLSQGHLFVHAAAVALGEAGYLVAGPSGAGKTTFLMHLLRLGGVDYVSNDRVLVREEAGGPRLLGMPAITTLRSSTLDLFPEVREALSRSCFSHRSTIRESEAAGVPARAWEDGRYGLTPAQFCRIMGVASRASVPATAVLLPTQTHRPGHITLTRLSPDEAVHRMLQAIFGIGCWSHETNVFALPGDREVTPAGELRRRCQRFAETVPVLECSLGLQAYDDPQSTRAMLARVEYRS